LRILYLSHISWNWIFQRPQLLALFLERDFDCTVLNKKYVLGHHISRNNVFPRKIKNVYLLPKANQIRPFAQINDFIYRQYVKQCRNYDVIWVCYPGLYQFIPGNYEGKIVYDCMDNHVAMSSEENRDCLYKEEQKLIERADLIFVTSEKLRTIIPNLGKGILVRNGYQNKVAALPIKKPNVKSKYVIGYFGTISADWFDFSLLQNGIPDFPCIEYKLLGPTEKGIRYDSFGSHIIFEGVVEHDELGEYISDYDALIMPFKLNDIILSVDPVKLYEYINFGKCIISIWYPEIERFEPFVYFYHNTNEYVRLLGELCKKGFPAKYDENQRKDFLKDNTWEERYRVVKTSIDDRLGERNADYEDASTCE